jgi:hypothetical protein
VKERCTTITSSPSQVAISSLHQHTNKKMAYIPLAISTCSQRCVFVAARRSDIRWPDMRYAIKSKAIQRKMQERLSREVRQVVTTSPHLKLLSRFNDCPRAPSVTPITDNALDPVGTNCKCFPTFVFEISLRANSSQQVHKQQDLLHSAMHTCHTFPF